MKKILLLLMLSMPAFAGDVTVLWDAPTTNTNGSTLTNLDGYFVKWGTTSGTYTNSENVTNEALTEWTVTGLTEGVTYYFVTTAYNTSGAESSPSNEVIYNVPDLVPSPPTNLQVQELVAYALSQSFDVVVLIPVGTVPAGTECNPDMTVNGLYGVPRDDVEWASSYRAPVVFAQCG